MRERLIEWLACPTCDGRLTLRGATGRGGDIRDGVLRCEGCDARYPIARGIPRLVPSAVNGDGSPEPPCDGSTPHTHFVCVRMISMSSRPVPESSAVM